MIFFVIRLFLTNFPSTQCNQFPFSFLVYFSIDIANLFICIPFCAKKFLEIASVCFSYKWKFNAEMTKSRVEWNKLLRRDIYQKVIKDLSILLHDIWTIHTWWDDCHLKNDKLTMGGYQFNQCQYEDWSKTNNDE